MNGVDFKSVMNALTDYYGDKAFSPHARNILYRILSPLSFGEAMRVVDLVAEEHGRAPTIAAIKKAALPFLRDTELRRQRLEIERLEEMREGRCKACDFSGYVLALRRDNPVIEYSFRCPSCPAAKARRIDERILEWRDELKASFIPVSFKNESHENARRLQRDTHMTEINKRRGGKIQPVNRELAAMAQSFAALAMERGVPADGDD